MRLGRRRNQVVAVEINVIEGSREAQPARYAASFGAYDVSRGFQAHASAAKRPFDQRNLQFNGGSRRNVARSKEIDARGAYILCYERDGSGFRASRNADQLQRQAQMSSRAAAAVFSNTDGVSRHAQKSFVVESGMDLVNFSSWSVNERGG